MRKNIVAGNWKMNKTLQEGIALAKELNEALAPKINTFFISPSCSLFHLQPLHPVSKRLRMYQRNTVHPL